MTYNNGSATKLINSAKIEDTEGGAALDILTKAVFQLSCVTETSDAELPLKQIKSLLQGDTCNGNLSSFELLHAGLVETLLKFLTPQPSDRETDVLQRVSKLLEVFAFNENNDFDPAPFSSLFHKVQQCLSQIEHFPVKVTEGSADSLSKVATTYQIKCLFRRHTDNSSSSLRQWGAGTVKVDPLAYVQALERYLLSRGYCREEEEEEDGDSSGDASEDEERIVSRQQNSPSKHRLTLTINNHPLPYNMTMYQAIKRYGTHTRLDDDAHPASHSAVWHNIHTIVYKTYESSDRVRSSAVKSAEDDPPPSSLLEKLGSAPPLLLEGYKGIGVIQLLHILHTISHEWILLLKTDDYNHPILNKELLVNKQIAAKHTRLDDDAHPASHSAVWHNIHTIVYKTYESSDRVRSSAVKSAEDDPPPSSLLEKLGSAPPLLLEGYKGIGVIQLLHILHTISHEWILLLKTDDYNHPILNKELLVNKQIAAKAERQLQDPLVIMTAEYPKWFTPLPYYTPFLFPFDVRLELLHATSFDRDRALQRLLELHPELGKYCNRNSKQPIRTRYLGHVSGYQPISHQYFLIRSVPGTVVTPLLLMTKQGNFLKYSGTSSENRSGIRLDKDKRCVDRDSVFEQGKVIMNELASSISLLEVYYVGEVGTGLGPTLEFYTLLSQAFQETQFGMWRECGTYEIGEKTYTTAPLGLYPRAVSQTDSPALKSLCDNFMFLGRVIGKAIIDNRILDINLSEPFYRWLLGTHEKMGLVTIKDIDEVLHSSLKQVEVFALRKDAILKRDDISEEERAELILQITDDDGGTLEDYCLDFILPGSDVELSPGGRNTALTIHNVEDYLCAVVNFTLKEGVRKQMEAVRTGFSSVMPLSNLQLFYANEMKILLCGTAEEKWSEDELKTAIQPDHGYNSQSSAVLFLIQNGSDTLVSKTPHTLFRSPGDLCACWQGVTSFTVVKKSVDGSPDDYLPSVMTCVNYLKLPDYRVVCGGRMRRVVCGGRMRRVVCGGRMRRVVCGGRMRRVVCGGRMRRVVCGGRMRRVVCGGRMRRVVCGGRMRRVVCGGRMRRVVCGGRMRRVVCGGRMRRVVCGGRMRRVVCGGRMRRVVCGGRMRRVVCGGRMRRVVCGGRMRRVVCGGRMRRVVCGGRMRRVVCGGRMRRVVCGGRMRRVVCGGRMRRVVCGGRMRRVVCGGRMRRVVCGGRMRRVVCGGRMRRVVCGGRMRRVVCGGRMRRVVCGGRMRRVVCGGRMRRVVCGGRMRRVVCGGRMRRVVCGGRMRRVVCGGRMRRVVCGGRMRRVVCGGRMRRVVCGGRMRRVVCGGRMRRVVCGGRMRRVVCGGRMRRVVCGGRMRRVVCGGRMRRVVCGGRMRRVVCGGRMRRVVCGGRMRRVVCGGRMRRVVCGGRMRRVVCGGRMRRVVCGGRMRRVVCGGRMRRVVCGGRVRKQMEAVRTGFSSVMPLSNLQLFYANEMKILLCGTAEEKWSEEELKTAIQPDHGYNSQSSAVLFLIQVMSGESPLLVSRKEAKHCPTGKLPVGGFRALHPRFTVVKKSVDGSPDDYLPSVMTCVNYLKLPDYSTAERLREKLLTAEPIRTRYFGHVTGYQPIRDQHFLILSVPGLLYIFEGTQSPATHKERLYFPVTILIYLKFPGINKLAYCQTPIYRDAFAWEDRFLPVVTANHTAEKICFVNLFHNVRDGMIRDYDVKKCAIVGASLYRKLKYRTLESENRGQSIGLTEIIPTTKHITFPPQFALFLHKFVFRNISPNILSPVVCLPVVCLPVVCLPVVLRRVVCGGRMRRVVCGGRMRRVVCGGRMRRVVCGGRMRRVVCGGRMRRVVCGGRMRRVVCGGRMRRVVCGGRMRRVVCGGRMRRVVCGGRMRRVVCGGRMRRVVCGGRVRKQMEAVRTGFSSVMPLSNLQLFYANEMKILLCGTAEEKWSEEELKTAIQPDHGYNSQSSAVLFLIQVMSGLSGDEQRSFLRFVTGCPKLPVGGFRALHPRFTVVKKSVDGSPDDYLPSVMTCVNYLKLPDYSTAERLREKLLTAEPIRTRYFGHVTGYQPIRDQHFLILSVPGLLYIFEGVSWATLESENRGQSIGLTEIILVTTKQITTYKARNHFRNEPL
eukprot:sb/3460550/